MENIYLDYAAATPLDSEVISAMQPFFSTDFYNPSATYLAGRAARQKLSNFRSEVAQTLGARPAEIIFTAGATEANNLAISGVMRQFPEGEVLVSSVEHESVLEPARQYKCREIPVTKEGVIDLNKLEKMISPKTKLVSVMLVNNELGTIQPVKEIAKILNKSSILLHTDAAQAPNIMDIHVSRQGADLVSLNGGKIYGAKQSGALYIRTGVKLQPLILGGGQEFGVRSGTENLAAAAGFSKALGMAQARRQQENQRLLKIRQQFIQGLAIDFPDITVNGSLKNQSPHILHLTFPGQDNERLMMQLDEAGIQAAVGSACSASKEESSHVLRAIGMSDKQARSSLRFSFGRQTTHQQIEKVLKTLKEILASNR